MDYFSTTKRVDVYYKQADSTPEAIPLYFESANQVLNLGGKQFIERAETLNEKFERLTREWNEATINFSSFDQIVGHPAYEAIMNLGKPVIPLIFADLASSPKHWFVALRKLTGADPIPRSASGNFKKMTTAWLKWGRKRAYC
jgi:hypothetical protein